MSEEDNKENVEISAGMVSEFARRKKLYLDWLAEDNQRERLIKRAEYSSVAQSNPHAQQLVWATCKNEQNSADGCIFFVENFCWTFDPRSENKNLPIVLFDYQKDFIRDVVQHIDEGRNFLIEKSRDMGMSWLMVYIFLWYWLFRDGVNLLLGSYKEKLVDDGSNSDALFGKLEFTIRNLPPWMLPRKFKLNKHRTKLKLLNPENNNIISGDTMNAQFGRGARKTAIFYDELGFWDTAKEAWEAGSQTTACQIANSTPHGRNFYWKLRNSNKMDVLTLHWKLHPLKDQQWYEFEKARSSEETVAQEIDLKYDKSLEGRVYREWEPDVGYYEYNPNLALYVGADWGNSDGTAIIWAQIVNGKFRVVDSFYKTGETIDFFVPFLTGIIPSDEFRYNTKEMEKIESHRNWKRGTLFGDPAGRFKSAVSNQTVFSILKDNGIIVNYKEHWKEFQTRKTATKMRIRKGVELNKNEDTDYLNLCIEQSAYRKTRKEGETAISSAKPEHNWTSHYRSALEYLCLGLEESVGHQVVVRDKFSKGSGKTFSPYARRRR